MDSETSDGLTTAIEKNVLSRSASVDEWNDFADSLRPKRAGTLFIAFASDDDRGIIPFWDVGKRKVMDCDLSRLVGTRSCVVEKEKQGMRTVVLERGAKSGGQKSIHF